MARTEFSDAQKNVINNPTDNILVSAAAGSGKTTVLVERIIDRIRKEELSIDKILVVTFTNDAAVNMQKKIEDALKKELEEAEDPVRRKHIREQQDKLANAYIQTFDSFCARVVTEKGYVLSDKERVCFEPGFGILDEGELRLLRSRAASIAIENAYLKQTGSGDIRSDFIKLTERFGDGRNDYALEDSLVSSYMKLRCLADYRSKISRSCDEYIEMNLTDRLHPVLKDIVQKLKDCADRFDDLAAIIGPDSGTYLCTKGKKKADELVSISLGILDGIRDGILNADRILAANGSAEDIINALRSVNVSDISLRNIDKEIPEAAPFFAVCKAYKAYGAASLVGSYDLSDGLNSIFEILINEPLDKIETMISDSACCVRAYKDLLLDMDDIFAELKYSVRGMDFADQEYAAFDIFSETEAADYYRARFSEIYVDEYQDNTDLQDQIIKKISKEGKNVFRVGDVKQSIYRFRNSDPTIFTGMLSDMEADPSFGTPLYLNENYRSRPEVLNFINFIFLQLMDRSVCGIDYPRQMLHFPKLKECGFDAQYIPDVLIVDEDILYEDKDEEDEADNGEETEAEDTAASEIEDAKGRPVECLKSGVEYLIRDYISQDPKERKLSDVCVLTETRGMASAITDHLMSRGIDAAGINITMIFTDNDIHRLASLIITLGNSCRDEYMLGVLLAPFDFSNFTFDEIGHINAYLRARDISNKISLIDRLRIYLELADGQTEWELYQRVDKFINVFDDLRSFAMTSSIASTLEEVFKKTHIKSTIDANYGDHTKINLFKNWIVSNFGRYGTDISGIANELEQMKIKLADGAAVESRDSNPDKVTVMNVHKSKGLEFKYVILVVKPKNKMSENTVSGIAYDDKAGWSADWYDDEKMCRKTSIEMILKNEDIAVEYNAELMRLLYVALTRAQNKLSIVMTADSSNEKKNSMYQSAGKNASLMLSPEVNRRETILRAKTGGIFYFLLLGLMRSPYWNNAVEERFGEAGLSCSDSTVTVNKDTFKDLLDDHDPFTVRIPDKQDIAGMSSEDLSGQAMDDSGEGEEAEEAEIIVLPEYRYQNETEIPFKVSVTAVSSGRFTSTTHVDMNIRSKEDYGQGKKILSSTAKGTILHILMRVAEPEEILSDYDGFVESLITDGFFSGADPVSVRKVASEFKDGVISFFNSDIGRRLDEADSGNKAKYEYPLVFSVYTDPNEPDRGSVLIQGIADLVFEEDDGYVLLDYKTDKLSDMSSEEREEEAIYRHSVQINSYAAAFAKSGKKVKEKWIYLVRYSQFVKIE